MVANAISDFKQNHLVWLRNRWGAIGGVAILYTIIYGVWTSQWGGFKFNPLISHFAFIPITFFTFIAAWRVYADTALDHRIRRAWLLFSIGIFLQIIGDVVAFYEDILLHIESVYFISDIFYFSFYPLVFWALLSLPGVSLDRTGWLKLILDLFVIMLSASMVVWYFVIAPAVNIQDNLFTPLIAALYPVSNLVVLGGVVLLLSRGRQQNELVRPSLLIFLAGLLCFLIAALVNTYFLVRNINMSGTWLDVGWLMAYIFFALAAIRQRSPSTHSYADSFVSRVLDLFPIVLPFTAIAIGYSLLIFVMRTIFSNDFQVVVVVSGAALLTVLVIGRQIIDLRENIRLNSELREFSATLEQRVAQRTLELEQSQEALLSSEKMAIVGTLAAGVAHEISNPLSAIITASEHLSDEIKNEEIDAETIQSYLKLINSSGLHALEIAQALRNQSRGRTPEHTPQKINDVLHEALMLMGGQIKRWNKVKVIDKIDPDLPLVDCDRNQISQVVFNLLNNARDAMPNGGVVTLRAYREGDKVKIEVSDQGVGISPEVKASLFKTFFTTKPIGKGTGLGLSIVRAIIDEHQGSIEAKSDGVGSGATFIVTLPIVSS